jgi:hypothetical protein
MISREKIREIAEELVREHAQDIEFLSVCERLGDLGVEDESGDLAREIHDLAMAADPTVNLPDVQEQQ